MTENITTIKQEDTFQKFSRAIYSLRAMAILFIIIYHFGFYLFYILPASSNGFSRIPFDFGDIGVDLFAFLSAMFLFINLCRKDEAKINWKSWYERRLSRIFPLLWLSFLIVIPASALLGNFYDLNSILLNMSGFSSLNGVEFMGYYWFITFILICYLVFPLIHLGINDNLRNALIVVIIAYTLFNLSYFPYWSSSPDLIFIWSMIARGWNFGFGALFGYWIGKNKMENLKYFTDKRLAIFSFGGMAALFSLYFYYQLPQSLGAHYFEKSLIFPILTLFLILCFIFLFMNIKKANKPINFIGKMNYEVFLLHGVTPEITLFIMFTLLLAPPLLIFVAFAIVFIIDILIAYPLKFMGDFVERKSNLSKNFKRGILLIAYGLMIYAIAELFIRNFINLSLNWGIAVITFSLILVTLISIELLFRKFIRKN